jgi:hypothetical protein
MPKSKASPRDQHRAGLVWARGVLADQEILLKVQKNLDAPPWCLHAWVEVAGCIGRVVTMARGEDGKWMVELQHGADGPFSRHYLAALRQPDPEKLAAYHGVG